jgi:hypothetical protein
MNTITIDDIEYINSEDVFIKAPIYCKDSRNGRELIKNKSIKDFIYAKPKDNKWIISNGKSYKYDKILLLKSFVDTITKITNPVIVDDKYDLAPDIINLENHEKFKDTDGNIIEIETIGERKVNGIYFKVKDVMIGFNIEHLLDTLVKNTTSYTENIDYKFFNLSKSDKFCRKQIKKELYLTYRGMLRVLFVSRSGKTDKFISWATETLFTVQLGEQEDKELLSSNLLGVNVKNIKSLFSTNSDKTPCVYLFIIGQANELLKSKKYNDSDYIFKFGYTNDLVRRTNEHYKTYKNEFNKEIQLVIFSIIDPQYISEAETSISHYFNENKLNGYKIKDIEQTELVIINKDNMNQIKEHYRLIQNSYIGHYKELYDKIHKLETELIQEKYKSELIIQTHKNELLIETHKNELKDKDIQLLEYKIKFLELNK